VAGELEQGFAAVLADPDAAAAVRAGRLATAPHLQAGGWPTTDIEDLTRADSPPRRAPDRRLAQARADADDAEQEEADARTVLDDAQHQQDRAQAAVRELRARLADAENAENDAGHALRHARGAHDRAERRVQATQRRLSDIESA
jgi:chromosome segregation ATPase